ncbi:JAB1/Mov34/MPN/PAD-1 ubiquitin protease domain-containing protein [Ditylenchus destructor]|uniref:JAB1/Mov34/MPN/PAD-1 ubiquitin protease domain-containing protein n=1 Tax=Ditylenchus destructor TaxID=166010 RepID=A0AAD4MZZ1_9BILA|nr:JAB1/Mov34/MPN/PAD-1 ubiquitin protease domain-containing protein [Ditylenchus destructor]
MLADHSCDIGRAGSVLYYRFCHCCIHYFGNGGENDKMSQEDKAMDTSEPTSSSQANMAQRRWQLENNMKDELAIDAIYKYDNQEQQMIRNAKPWEKDPHYFKEVKISALALLKMVMHAKSGGNIEIMGLMQGRVDANTLIVMDSFALPVEGTETRVNAQAQAYEFMTTYSETCEPVGRLEKVIGWYHSHPGYGCWLSGIDVSTQALNQQFQEPFVAVVIDPIRTVTAGKVDLGAFRTYPKGYKPPEEGPSEYQTIPLSKIEDFGVHCKQYYPLEVTYFKSSLDNKVLEALWKTYWVNTLSANPLVTNASYITSQLADLGAKLEQIRSRGTNSMPGEKIDKSKKDAHKLGCEVLQGLMGQVIKNNLFNGKDNSKKAIELKPIEAFVEAAEVSV